MIDHVTLNVKDLASSRRFYEAALKPLGYEVIMAFPEAIGLGRPGKPDFWIAVRDNPSTRVHIALQCDRRKTVDEFHAAALRAGGTDNGKPGIREYHPSYYGAFVFDPDGNNIEAVCHDPRG